MPTTNDSTGRTTTGDTGDRGDPIAVAAMITELASASPGAAADLRRLAGVLGEGVAPAVLDRALDLALGEALETRLARGWSPGDCVQITRRRAGATTEPLLLDLLAADAERRPRGWAVQLSGLDAVVWWDRAVPLARQWRSRRGLRRAEVLRLALGLVRLLCTLPRLPALPGGDDAVVADAQPGAGPDAVDPKILARVRALLAKAESTAYHPEAEALSAKAQELMARHALDAAVAAAQSTSGDAPARAGARRLWLDPPYTSAKSSLVTQVCDANRCKAVQFEGLDLVTVVGHPADLDTVELLVTSLLVQAGRAMLAADPGTSSTGRSRARSFRHAFLLSYAARVGQRLRAAADEAERAARASVGAALVPVLDARRDATARTVSELFPTVSTRKFTARNTAGWAAGRAAADAADLSPGRDSLQR